jgi:hypothetical protein
MSGTKRQPVPEPVKRDILLESGYRCAIPRCMAHTLEIAHIVSYEESGGDNSRENLIALCPNHHTMYDVEKKIYRKAMKIIKNKLGIINGRYNDFEQRVFRRFACDPKMSEVEFTDAVEVEILLLNAVEDGYLRKVDVIQPHRGGFTSGYMLAIYKITPEGREFIRKWLSDDEELP